MEAATVFTISSLYKMRAGAIFAVIANRVRNDFSYNKDTVDKNIEVANLALQILYSWDLKKKVKNKKNIYPSLISE